LYSEKKLFKLTNPQGTKIFVPRFHCGKRNNSIPRFIPANETNSVPVFIAATATIPFPVLISATVTIPFPFYSGNRSGLLSFFTHIFSITFSKN